MRELKERVRRVTPLGSLNPLQGVGSLPGLCLLLGQLSCFDPMATLAQDTPLGSIKMDFIPMASERDNGKTYYGLACPAFLTL